MTQRRVFLLQSPPLSRDISTATQYGTVLPIFSSEETPSAQPLAAQRKLLTALETFDPERDYLCFAGGDPWLPFLAAAVLWQLGLDAVSILRWDRERREGQRVGYYVPVKVPFLQVGAAAVA